MTSHLPSFTAKDIQSLPAKVVIHPEAELEIDKYSKSHFGISGTLLLRAFQIMWSWPKLDNMERSRFKKRRCWFKGKLGAMSRPKSVVDSKIGRMHLYSPNRKEKLKPNEPLRRTKILSTDRTKHDWLYEKDGVVSPNILKFQLRTSDTYLIYCSSVHTVDKYCLLGIVDPDAHYDCEQLASFAQTFETRAETYQQSEFSK
ncbi:type II toxin-antitoxin system YafO family toxin [Vibrio parahaemolyticus]|uniref:type II toxin-antitoxin system YafO family toxin n=1 Tax=Vibrio parahaemolyticus TaxID=670 RepID=UPI00040521DE|nr:type II toxin-antitoxin system YafO family toxin [Vibrio parahaemolyticus]MDF4764793.1 type II toxin-antitoxin system YafO family toxin [Vibrio parahaemolyticus]HBC3407576.1 type II toxin-antitoxin system YafO family toxin [Vibrio parahaemolyticus]HBN6092742.1 type II toxin-antitoxin system YafO family toxin [Vibrio parahaemolyticus]HBN6183587.1 type II toxin-antitoxin system YafO family toxin [Vibrio parahaemolyticus]